MSRLSVLIVFIHSTKLTRCHRHTISDRTSTINDESASLDNIRKYGVTGVPLKPSHEVVVPDQLGEDEDWWITLRNCHPYPKRVGSAPNPKRMPTRIGGLSEAQLLQFFRLHNGRRYLHCGCDLEEAIFDFVIWKTIPPLISPLTGVAECIGNPFDPRTRAIVIAVLSSVGFGIDNLDSAFKYNREGKLNDLSKAPLFIQNFWKERKARRRAQLTQAPKQPKAAVKPKPRAPLEYLEIDDLHGPVEKDPFGQEDQEKPPKFGAITRALEEEENQVADQDAVPMILDDEMGALQDDDRIQPMDVDQQPPPPNASGVAARLARVKQELHEPQHLPPVLVKQEEAEAIVAATGEGPKPLREVIENGVKVYLIDSSDCEGSANEGSESWSDDENDEPPLNEGEKGDVEVAGGGLGDPDNLEGSVNGRQVYDSDDSFDGYEISNRERRTKEEAAWWAAFDGESDLTEPEGEAGKGNEE